MQDYIEFELNGVSYSAGVIAIGEYRGWFCWSNDRDEEGKAVATLYHAQQDALEWELNRKERYEGSEAQEIDARNSYYNQRTDDARYAKHEE